MVKNMDKESIKTRGLPSGQTQMIDSKRVKVGSRIHTARMRGYEDTIPRDKEGRMPADYGKIGRAGMGQNVGKHGIVETNPYKDPANIANREAHSRALHSKPSLWGTPAMREAARQGKNRSLPPSSVKAENVALKAGIERMANDIIRNGMPKDTLEAARLTETFGPGGIARLLEISRKKALGQK